MSKRVYITTPIYYANAAPHIGNSYTSFICDVIARTKRMCGYQVKFCTGTDENGQKMTQKAAEHGKDVMVFLDEVAAVHQHARDTLRISYTDFIRTSSPEHHAFVQKVLQKTHDVGDIYSGMYEGLYCIGCEAFKKETDLIDHDGKRVCPDHLAVPERIQEKNWFFALSTYEKKLLEIYKRFESFCYPHSRFNEVISFVEQGLDDFSISREGSTFGIPIPFDTNSVTYIWFDALYNYLTACAQRNTVSGGDDDMVFRNDAQIIHAVGKDIARFHAVYRPAMLMSAGYKLPDMVLINGFFTVDGQKMSKTLGNVIDPLVTLEEHGRDALVYYFFSDIKIGSDGDFSRARFAATKESALKKGRGNLVSRVVRLAIKNEVLMIDLSHKDLETLVPLAEQEELTHNALWQACIHGGAASKVDSYLHTFDLLQLTRDRFALVQFGNKFIDTTQPRVTIKDNPQQAKKDLERAIRLLKNIALLSASFLIEGWEKIQTMLIVDHPEWKTFTTDHTATSLNTLVALQKFAITYQEGHLYT